MKSAAPSYHIEVVVSDEEPPENAVKRFRREVMNVGLTFEVRRRRYFENSQDEKKRRKKDLNQRRSKKYVPPPSYEDVSAVMDPTPFAEMFGETEDLFEVGFRAAVETSCCACTESRSRASTSCGCYTSWPAEGQQTTI
ncbi:hypothetical protein WJX81_008550 [Elliptochloris bilobata]|uniref:30S ribosomal protein S21 n=1 Tax=Elliptochloris bilobata TaxID=381761 RepID=A0AAW1R0S4_9CHLO